MASRDAVGLVVDELRAQSSEPESCRFYSTLEVPACELFLSSDVWGRLWSLHRLFDFESTSWRVILWNSLHHLAPWSWPQKRTCHFCELIKFGQQEYI